METSPLTKKDQNNASPTALRVLAHIESGAVMPYGRYRFILQEWFVWCVWFMTVLFGGAALSVTFYATMSANYAFYEATHENFLTFVITVAPYLWVLLFFGTICLAAASLQSTKHGYRHSLYFLVGSSLGLSVILALLSHAGGLGYRLDAILGEKINMYQSMEKMEIDMWQMPNHGRLVGKITYAPEVIKGEGVFYDIDGEWWSIEVSELKGVEIDLLQEGRPVRLLGTTTSERVFHACGVFPWIFDRPMARNEMESGRQAFDTTMARHQSLVQADDSAMGRVPSSQLCAHLEMMQRMPQRH